MGITGEAGAHRVCALKIIRDLATDRDPAELAARFLDEAKIVTKLSHENLVYVFDYGVNGNQGYLAMEFVEGKTLTELWNRCAMRGVGFPVGTSLHIVGELCAGLGYAHRTGDLRLVHRDVSPSNVMLSYNGGVKLIDFGLAKWKSKVAETASGINWGKVSYMSPEQHLGRNIDHRSDLFSAGLMLWELLTGRQLFPSADARTGELDIPPPSQLNPHIPPDLDATVMRALAENPDDRFQTGEEMSAALAAHTPREAGKLALGEFVRSLFEIDMRTETDEREILLAGARSVPASGEMPALPNARRLERRRARSTAGVDAGRPLLRPPAGGRRGHGAGLRGHHTGIGKRVAIKIPRHGERRKSELLARFKLEAQAASQIRHPNIADVTDCGSTPDGRFFFVMEFVDGVDLGHLVRRQGPLPIERSLIIAVQVCRAIEAAHKAGIIHRDLKPSNVMMLRDRDRDRDDRDSDFVKVLDFGVAKFLRADVASLGTDLSRAESAVGTPKYMAPEQIRTRQRHRLPGRHLCPGRPIYFMLSGGHAPIEGESVENVWRKKVTEEATPLRKWRSDLPPTVDALVMRCLAREPGRRPVSMEVLRKELLAAIERLRQVSSSVLARAPSSTSVVEERAAGATYSGRSRAATALMLGLGGGMVGGLALLVDRAADPGPTPTLVAAEAPVPPPRGASRPAAPRLRCHPQGVAARPSPPRRSHPHPHQLPAPPPSIGRGRAIPPGRGQAPTPPHGGTPAAAGADPAAGDTRSLAGRGRGRVPGGPLLRRRDHGPPGSGAGGGTKALLLLGKIYRTTGEFDRALEAYDEILRKSPGDTGPGRAAGRPPPPWAAPPPAQAGQRQASASPRESSR